MPTRDRIESRQIRIRMNGDAAVGTRPRRLNVDAKVLGRWAWHLSMSFRDQPLFGMWTVTHVPTGLAGFTLLRSERCARLVAQLFAERFADYRTKAQLDALAARMRSDPAWQAWLTVGHTGRWAKPPAHQPRPKRARRARRP